MRKEINYRQQLLKAVDAFLEGTPESRMQAQRIINRCYKVISSKEKEATFDEIVWSTPVFELTDSVFYQDEKYLRETRELLLGHTSKFYRAIFSKDYRAYFTTSEAEWYSQLSSMTQFLMDIPFEDIYNATSQARRNSETWESMSDHISEVIQADKIDKEYERRKDIIENISKQVPLAKNIGGEKIYLFALREITSILTGIKVGKAAVYFGYPVLNTSYTHYGNLDPSKTTHLNMLSNITWSRKTLEAISGKNDFFISWYWSKAGTSHHNMLIVSVH